MRGPTKKKHVHLKFMKAVGGIDEAFERVHASKRRSGFGTLAMIPREAHACIRC